MLKTLLSRIIISIKFYSHYSIGRFFGISHVIRYLRNPDPLISARLLRAFGAKIGKDTTIKRTVYFDNVYEDGGSAGDFSNFEVGTNCYIGDCTYFDLSDKIIVGNNVVISGCVSFITHADCNRSRKLSKAFPRKHAKIVIQDGSWIAFKTTILNGVTVGKNSVVSAHSLAKSDIPDCSLCAGTPARKIRDIAMQLGTHEYQSAHKGDF